MHDAVCTYDALHRATDFTDSRGKATTHAYNTIGQLESATDAENNVTKFGYYPFDHANAGQLHWKENGLNKRVYYAYNDAGQVTHQWGAADYPLQYDYNGYGQMTELKTYQADDGAMWSGSTKPGAFGTAIASTTTWQYDPASGVLVQKLDANLKGASYGYYDNKLLASRLWARGLITGYSYNGAGDLETIDYGDQITQDVTHSYHRDGRRKTTFDAAGLHTYHYENLGGLPSGETITGGLLDGVSYSYPNDGLGRRQSFSASLGGQQLLGVGYGYTPESRLHTVTAGPLVTTYGYVANSDLIGSVTGSRGGATMLASSRVYDNVARLDVITNTTGAGPVLSSHDYDYDAAHRRYKATRENGDYWSYGYNDRNEVTGGSKHHSDTILYEGMGYGYGFDAIGNRKTSTVAYEGASLTTTYTPNALNQYASIASPGSFVVSGRAETAAAVSVNTTAATRQGDYYHHKIDVDNTAGAVWSDVDVEGDLTGQLSAKGGGRYTPAASLAPTHDDDGNLTFDGRWINVWNGENRLISAETAPTAPIGMPKQRLEMIYDAQGRRISRKLFDWDSVAENWELKTESSYLYDWWNCVAVLDGTGALQEAYVWGTDLAASVAGSPSGPSQGAGGVGGLLAAWLPTDNGLTSVFYGYDGNGNVMGLASGTTGAQVAKYDYTPFGEVAERDGVLASMNDYRFSTKPEDAQLALLYYGFRYYNSSTGRWASRDPIGERGGVNLVGFVENKSQNTVDAFGLQGLPSPERIFQILADPANYETDWAGREILYRWATGGGDWNIRNDRNWESYMKANNFIRDGVSGPKEKSLGVKKHLINHAGTVLNGSSTSGSVSLKFTDSAGFRVRKSR